MSQALAPYLEQIRQRIPLSDLIGKQTRVIRKGRAIKALCLFHKEKTASLNIDDVKGLYHCFGCGASGDHFSFIMQTQNLNFLEACQFLADQIGLKLPQDAFITEKPRADLFALLEKTCSWFQEQLQRSHGEEARQYLANRSITTKSIQDFRLGYAPASGLLTYLKTQGFSEVMCVEAGVALKSEAGSIYERFKNRIIFPIVSLKNQVIGFGGRIIHKGEPKYLNSPETEIFQKRYVLYGLSQARKNLREQAIVVEGYMDVIRLHQEGFPIAVAPLGTAFTIEQLQQIWRYIPSPYIAFDGDEAGQKAAVAAVERAIPYLKANNTLKILFLPNEDDPDSFVKREGIQKFQEFLQTAMPLSQFLWQEVTKNYTLEKLTPEEFVSIKNILKEYLKKIQSLELRKAYIKHFDQFLNQLPQNTSIKPHRKVNIPIIQKKINLEKILLVTILNHPYLWEEVGESLMHLTFIQPEDENLRLKIVEYFLEISVKQQKEWPDFCAELQKVANTMFYTRAPFAKIGYDQKMALSGWWETYKRLTNHTLKADQLQHADMLKHDMTPSNWERLKALKKTLTYKES